MINLKLHISQYICFYYFHDFEQGNSLEQAWENWETFPQTPSMVLAGVSGNTTDLYLAGDPLSLLKLLIHEDRQKFIVTVIIWR